MDAAVDGTETGMIMVAAQEIIANALRLYGILDEMEEPQDSDYVKCVPILNNLLRNDYADAAVQFLINRTEVLLPAGMAGRVYSFVIGPSGEVPVDAVAMRAMWMNDVSGNLVNRETREAPIADVVRTTNIGIITKWHQERQIDGSVRVTAWQAPNRPVKALIEYGGRVAPITDRTSLVGVPPEGVHDVELLLGRRLCSSYGRTFEATSPVGVDALAIDSRWRQWARGQMWLRFVRS